MPVTNFPKAGEDKPVSLQSSQWPLFPVSEAEDIKQNYPELWDAGGNVLGNKQYNRLAPMARDRRAPETPTEEEAVRLREAWVARHREDFRLAGVIAQVKWLAIGSRGLDYMRKLIAEAKAKARERRSMRYVQASYVAHRPATEAELAGILKAAILGKDSEGYAQSEDMPGPEVFTFTITTGALDRQGEIVDPDGWDFRSFEANPVILDCHEAESIMDILGRGLPPIRRVASGWELDVILSSCDKGRHARNLILEGMLRSVSVGFRSLERERSDGALIHRRAELLEVSLVPIPANPEAMLVRRSGVATVTKVAGKFEDLPVDLDSAWDGSAAEARVRTWASSDGSGDKAMIDWAKYARAFLWHDADMAEEFTGYKLGFADIKDGELTLVASGLAAAAAALGGARGGVDIPEADRPEVMALLERLRELVAKARAEAEGKGDMSEPAEPEEPTEPMDGSKAGRVLNRQNEGIVRAIREHAMALVEAVDQLLAQVPGEEPVPVEPSPYPPEAEAMPEANIKALADMLRAVLA